MAYIENKAEKIQNQRNAEVVKRLVEAVDAHTGVIGGRPAWDRLIEALAVAQRCPACDGIGIVVGHGPHNGTLRGCEVCKSFEGYSHPELIDKIRNDGGLGVNCEITLKLIVDFAWPPTAREAAENVKQAIEVREVEDVEALIEETVLLDVHRV